MSKKYDLSQPKLKKIAVCGTACQGKSTLIKDMITRWPQLTSPEKSYRDIIREKGLVINQDGNEESQLAILNVLIDQVMDNYGRKKVVFDRCPLDNLIYSLWLNDKHPDRMPDAAIEKTITLVRESMKFLDAIFFIPITSVHKVPIVPSEQRAVDPQYIEEIDNLFKAVINTQKTGIGKFFPIKDCPPVIEVFGDRETRIKMLELYINDECEFIGCDDSVMNELAQNANDAYNLGNIITKPTK
jgi:predicted ATPase